MKEYTIELKDGVQIIWTESETDKVHLHNFENYTCVEFRLHFLSLNQIEKVTYRII